MFCLDQHVEGSAVKNTVVFCLISCEHDDLPISGLHCSCVYTSLETLPITEEYIDKSTNIRDEYNSSSNLFMAFVPILYR